MNWPNDYVNRFVQGHILDVFKGIPDESVHMVVTSPPYWGLRDYGTDAIIWGDHSGCEHVWDLSIGGGEAKQGKTRWQHNIGDSHGFTSRAEHPEAWMSVSQGAFCRRCGAWRGSLGLEPTVEMYVQHLVEIFREAKRVLRRDGTLWLNMGDSYAGSGKGYTKHGRLAGYMRATNRGSLTGMSWAGSQDGLKPKDLCGIPWRLAFALQADGWWLRSDIIWPKDNPMPESVRDRPTRSHEYIFLLTKSGEPLYWTHPRKRGVRQRPQADYVWRHLSQDKTIRRRAKSLVLAELEQGGWFVPPEEVKKLIEKKVLALTRSCIVDYPPVSKRLLKKFWRRQNLWEGHTCFYDQEAVREPLAPSTLADSRNATGRHSQGAMRGTKYVDGNSPALPSWYRAKVFVNPISGRNLRSVWPMPTQPFKGAHFATFPEKLVEKCVLAGTSPRACPKCGAPWERVVSSPTPPERLRNRGGDTKMHFHPRQVGSGQKLQNWRNANPPRSLGFRPTCACDGNDGTGKCIVLDPFMGSGTTACVAVRLGRDFVGIDLNEHYCEMARQRLAGVQPELQFGHPGAVEIDT